MFTYIYIHVHISSMCQRMLVAQEVRLARQGELARSIRMHPYAPICIQTPYLRVRTPIINTCRRRKTAHANRSERSQQVAIIRVTFFTKPFSSAPPPNTITGIRADPIASAMDMIALSRYKNHQSPQIHHTELASIEEDKHCDASQKWRPNFYIFM